MYLMMVFILLSKKLSNNNNSLGVISLMSTGITATGAKYFAQMLETNTILFFLHIWDNEIGDEGVRMLSTPIANQNSKLKYLGLTGNKLTDGSVDDLIRMIQHSPSLKEITLRRNNFSDIGKGRLIQAGLSKNGFRVLF